MKEELHQGDILKIERIKKPVLIVSKDFFNQTFEIIGCLEIILMDDYAAERRRLLCSKINQYGL